MNLVLAVLAGLQLVVIALLVGIVLELRGLRVGIRNGQRNTQVEAHMSGVRIERRIRGLVNDLHDLR